jgi:hypothetical protein
MQIGQVPQYQPNIIQNSPQQNAQKTVQQQVQKQQTEITEQPKNENFQKLAEQVLAKRASGEAVQKLVADRGQVIDLLV